jgi:WD40 repeat protein/DNA-binding SARP family transcriptional activator
MLEIDLLGQFSVRINGSPVEIPSRPAQSLLAYLALNASAAHRREKLAGIFWPDSPEADARRNLRQALWYIRRAIDANGRKYLRSDDISIALDGRADYRLDADVLMGKAAGIDPNDWAARVQVYQGELLPGFYDDWVTLERERLQAVFEQCMRQHLDRLIQEGQWQAVLDSGERWIAFGQTPEPAYRALMTAHHAQGDASGLHAAYRRCVEALERDLGVEPSETTRRLYERLSRSQPSSLSNPSGSPVPSTLESEPPPHQEPTKPRPATAPVLKGGRVARHIRPSVVLALALVGVVLAAAVIYLQIRSRELTDLSASRQLAGAAVENLSVDPERSLLLSLSALNRADTPEAEDALHGALQADRILRRISPQLLSLNRIAFSLDGGRLAVSGEDPGGGGPLTEVWDLSAARRLFSVPGWLYRGSGFSGGRLLTASPTGENRTRVVAWDAQTGQQISMVELDYPFRLVGCATLRPDEQQVIVCLPDGTTRLFDLQNGEVVLIVGTPGGAPAYGAAISPDGRYLVTSVDHVTEEWEVAAGVKRLTLPSDPGGAEAPVFSRDSSRIAYALGSVVKMVDADTGKELLSLPQHAGRVTAVAFAHQTWLAASATDSTILVWDARSGRLTANLAGHTGPVTDVAFGPFSPRLASIAEDGTARVWDISPLAGREASGWMDENGLPYLDVAYNPDGTRLAVAGGAQAGEIWNLMNGERALTLRGLTRDLGALAFSPDGQRVGVANGEATARIWDLPSGQALFTLAGHSGPVTGLAFSPDGKLLATVAMDGRLKVWEAGTGLARYTLEISARPFLDSGSAPKLDFSPDGRRIVTGGGTKVRIWQADSGATLAGLPDLSEAVTALAFSPDGERLALGLAQGEAGVWDVKSGRKQVDLFGHRASVTAIRFSRDGRQMLTSSVDGSVRLWDAASGKELHTLARLAAPVTGAAFSPDGDHVAVSSRDGVVRILTVNIRELIQIARARLTRPFTLDECRTFLHIDSCPKE